MLVPNFQMVGAAALAALVLGFGAAEGLEHAQTKPLLLRWTGKSLARQWADDRATFPARLQAAAQAGADKQANADKPAFDDWAARLKECNRLRTEERDHAAAQLEAAEKSTINQASANYRLGRATCGGSHAPAPSGGTGRPDPIGLRPSQGPDLRALLAPGAYAPGQQSPLRPRQ